MDKRGIRRIDRHLASAVDRVSRRSVRSMFSQLSPDEKRKVVEAAKNVKKKHHE